MKYTTAVLEQFICFSKVCVILFLPPLMGEHRPDSRTLLYSYYTFPFY